MTPAEAAKQEGLYLRKIIRRNKDKAFTNSEIKCLIAIVNLWLYHRNGTKGFIHPGCPRIAKKVKVCRKTVSRSLECLRDLGIISPIKHMKGGCGKATQYVVDVAAIVDAFDPSDVTSAPGELTLLSGTFEPENVPSKAGQNVPLSIGDDSAIGEVGDARQDATTQGVDRDPTSPEVSPECDTQKGPFQENGSWEDWLTRQGQILERENPKFRLITGGRA